MSREYLFHCDACDCGHDGDDDHEHIAKHRVVEAARAWRTHELTWAVKYEEQTIAHHDALMRAVDHFEKLLEDRGEEILF